MGTLDRLGRRGTIQLGLAAEEGKLELRDLEYLDGVTGLGGSVGIGLGEGAAEMITTSSGVA